jgi:hypothetical protein
VLETQNVKSEDYLAWRRAQVAVNSASATLRVMPLKLVHESDGKMAASCQWGRRSSQEYDKIPVPLTGWMSSKGLQIVIIHSLSLLLGISERQRGEKRHTAPPRRIYGFEPAICFRNDCNTQQKSVRRRLLYEYHIFILSLGAFSSLSPVLLDLLTAPSFPRRGLASILVK